MRQLLSSFSDVLACQTFDDIDSLWAPPYRTNATAIAPVATKQQQTSSTIMASATEHTTSLSYEDGSNDEIDVNKSLEYVYD